MKLKTEMADIKTEDSLSNDDYDDNNTTASSYSANQSQTSVSRHENTFKMIYQKFNFFLVVCCSTSGLSLFRFRFA